MFTNEASAYVSSWPPTATENSPVNNSWNSNTTFTWNVSVNWPNAGTQWDFLWYWGEWNGTAFSYYAYLGHTFYTGNQTIVKPWASSGFNSGITLADGQYCGIALHARLRSNGTERRYYYYFHTANATVPIIPVVLTENRTIGSTDTNAINGAPVAYSLYSIPYSANMWPKYVESMYNAELEGTIREVNLAIYSSNTWGLPPWYDNADLTDFELYISTGPFDKHLIGAPTNIDWISYPVQHIGNAANYYGIMTWDNLNLSINNKASILKYLCFELKDYNTHFAIRYGLSDVDINQDNNFDCYFVARNDKYANGYKDEQGIRTYNYGLFPFPDGSYAHDLGWSFVISINGTSEGIPNLGANALDVRTPYGKKQYQPVYCNYAVDDLTIGKQINVTIGGAPVTDQGAPFPIEIYQGTYVYVPQTTGALVFTLRNSTAPYGLIATSTSNTIATNSEDNWLECLPAMGSTINTVTLKYKYLPTKYGVIGVFANSADTNDITLAIDQIGNISTGTGKEITYKPPSRSYPEDRIYYRLFCTNLTEPVALGSPAQFEVYSEGQTFLSVDHNPLTIGPEGGIETFRYSHNYVNARVGIFTGPSLNKLVLLKEVGAIKTGAFEQLITTTGDRFVALQVQFGSQWIMITNIPINVSYVQGYIPPTPSGGIADIRVMIGPMWCAVIGLIFVILFVLSPTIISIKTRKQFNVPSMAYVLLGAAGIAISMVLNLWPFWIAFFLLGIAIITMVFLYVYQKGWITLSGR
jgi:hypothetical protein